MICPICGVEFKGGAFIRSRGPGTTRHMRKCPNGHEFEEPQRVRVDNCDRIVSDLRAERDWLRAQLTQCVEYIEQDSEYPAEVIDPARAALAPKETP